MIEIVVPDAHSCNACSSMDAMVGIKFSSNQYQGMNVRLCIDCARDLRRQLQDLTPHLMRRRKTCSNSKT